MRDETRLGLLALGGAAVLGLLGDLLLRAIPWGLNAPLWILALVVVGGLLVSRARLPVLGEGRWLVLVALAFAGGIALRDSPALFTVNVLAVLLTLGLAGHRGRGGWPRLGGLPQYIGALLSAGLHACGGVLVLTLYDVRWTEVPRTGWSAVVLATLRGLLIAIPLLMVFGALFMAADAVFSGIVTNLLAIDVRELFSHLFWIGAWSWLTAGFLRQVLFCTIAIDGFGGPSKSRLTPLAPDDPRATEETSTMPTMGPPPLRGANIGSADPLRGANIGSADVPTAPAPLLRGEGGHQPSARTSGRKPRRSGRRSPPLRAGEGVGG